MKNIYEKPLFLGLTHIGQVFSIGWSEKFNGCSVFDFNKKLLNKFKNSNLTDEEPNLKKIYKRNKKKIFICNSEKDIKYYKNIFLTIDTPLLKEGKPNYNYIKTYIKKSAKYFAKNTNIIITSQVYCGFCDELYQKILINRKDLNIIYMAETLVMGNALKRFLEPERLIFGARKKIKLFDKLKNFNCPIFILSYKQAEMIKMAINLYLLTSVSYANLLDIYCREFGFKFSSINKAIKLDKRIGQFSYISPSLGISGGHLERDLFSIVKSSKSLIVKSIFSSFKQLSKIRMKLLIQLYEKLSKIENFKKIIWIGPSYKKVSFSILNSPFYHFRKYLHSRNVKLFCYDSHFDLKINKIQNIIRKIELKTFVKSLVILNYIDNNDSKKLKKLLRNNKIKVIDIGINKNLKISEKNIISLLN